MIKIVAPIILLVVVLIWNVYHHALKINRGCRYTTRNGVLNAFLIVVCIVAIGCYYQGISNTALNSTSLVGQGSSLTSSAAQKSLNQVWSDAQNMIDDSKSNNGLSQYFVNDNDDGSNSDQLPEWTKDEAASNTLSSVKLTPQVESVHGKSVEYRVNYIFKFHDGNEKHQNFVWHAKFAKQNGEWKIASNKANRS